jgi:molecular chaperone DnaK
MKQDAESYAAEDQQRREEVEIRNQADTLAYTAEKTIHDAGDKLSAEIRADIEARVKDVRDASSAQAGVDTIRAALAGLSESLQKAGAAVYGAGAEEGAADPQAGSPPEGDEERPAEEGTVEGEFREV